MNPILQPVDDLLTQKDQQILLLQKAASLPQSVYPDLECYPWLVAPGTAANTPGSPSTMTPSQSLPSASGSAWVGISPSPAPGGAWADAYFYKHLQTAAPAFNMFNAYAFELYLLMNSAQASNCVELDIQHVISGQVFNTGLQFNFGGNAVRVWDRFSKQWESIPGMTCPRWTPDAWNHVLLETRRDGASVSYTSFSFNGVLSVLTAGFAAPRLGLPDMLNCAVQLDSDKAGTPYRLYLDRVKFTASQRA